MVARFSTPVQTGPGPHPASYTMGTGSLPGLNRPGRGVDHPPHLVLRLKKEYSHISTPPLALRGLLWDGFYLYLLCTANVNICTSYINLKIILHIDLVMYRPIILSDNCKLPIPVGSLIVAHSTVRPNARRRSSVK